ncbi:hypothetical protein HY418_02045 [Candidatus Kaiserbacteria bacterium]|nr:hypothetical protein [Candidatus Kaiserbacteria bacterium]
MPRPEVTKLKTIRKILLVAHDKASCTAFAALAAHLTSLGLEVKALLADAGRNPTPSDSELFDAVKWWADIVLIGMSSEKNAGPEITAASLAYDTGKPYGFYADTFGAWKREWFSGFRVGASFLFVVNDDERLEAAPHFRNAHISPTGNTEWWKYFVPADREASRALVSAKPGDCVILIPFTKDPAINRTKVSATIDTVNACPGAFRVVFNVHPGDKTSPDTYMSEFAGKLKDGSASSLTFSAEPADNLVPAADVLVGPATSPSIHAMAREIVVIDILDPTIEAWLRKDIGNTRTYAGRHGGSFEPKSSREFAEILLYLTGVHMSGLVRDDELAAQFKALRGRQKELVPRSVEGEAVARMADAILKL